MLLGKAYLKYRVSPTLANAWCEFVHHALQFFPAGRGNLNQSTTARIRETPCVAIGYQRGGEPSRSTLAIAHEVHGRPQRRTHWSVRVTHVSLCLLQKQLQVSFFNMTNR